MRRVIGGVVVAAVGAGSAFAAIPARVVLQSGDVVGAYSVGSSIRQVAVNPDGGFAVRAETVSGPAGGWSILGDPLGLGGAIGVVASDHGPVGGPVALVYDSLGESRLGLGRDGHVWYSASDHATLFAPEFWRDTTKVLDRDVESDTTGYDWDHFEDPRITDNGDVWMIGSAGSGYGLFRFDGVHDEALLENGDTPSGLSRPLSSSGTFRAFDVSDDGGHWSAAVNLGLGIHAVVVNGGGFTIDSRIAEVNQPVSPAVAGVSDATWLFLNETSTNNRGDVIVTGAITSPTSPDRTIMTLNDTRMLAQGDVHDGRVLSVNSGMVDLNNSGDWIATWDQLGLHTNNINELLFVNGELVLKSGDGVDLDGDGLPDPGVVFRGVDQGAQPVGMTDRRSPGGAFDVYASALVTVYGQNREVVLRLTIPTPGAAAALALGCLGACRRQARKR